MIIFNIAPTRSQYSPHSSPTSEALSPINPEALLQERREIMEGRSIVGYGYGTAEARCPLNHCGVGAVGGIRALQVSDLGFRV